MNLEQVSLCVMRQPYGLRRNKFRREKTCVAKLEPFDVNYRSYGGNSIKNMNKSDRVQGDPGKSGAAGASFTVSLKEQREAAVQGNVPECLVVGLLARDALPGIMMIISPGHYRLPSHG
jgi:hypothetical protein